MVLVTKIEGKSDMGFKEWWKTAITKIFASGVRDTSIIKEAYIAGMLRAAEIAEGARIKSESTNYYYIAGRLDAAEAIRKEATDEY